MHSIHPTRRPRRAPTLGWGQPPGWSPLIDDGPRALQAARSLGRWLWPTLAVAAFLALAGYVLAHDDPHPGLSQRGLLTISLAAVVVVLLTIRRAAGPGPLARAVAEYAVVALLAVLVATLGVDASQPPADGTQASAAPDHRPAVLRTIDGFRDWLGEWLEWAQKETDRRQRADATTTRSPAAASPHSPLPPSTTTRRPT